MQGFDVTCIAWNHGSNTLSFAAGTKDGSVLVWAEGSNLTENDKVTVAPGNPGVGVGSADET